MQMELLIGNSEGNAIYAPVVEEGVEWSTERRGSPGKLSFKLVKDEMLDFTEGSHVEFSVDGKGVFSGFVFKKQRSKDLSIAVTAYDQLRYLKNKDSLAYENKTTSDLLKTLARTHSLTLGTMEDTGYKIPTAVEDNTSLFEMVENSLDITLTNTKQMYILYDDFGKLTLKSLPNMYVQENGIYLMIDEESGENYDYTSSIDDNTYNRIKLICEEEEGAVGQVIVVQDLKNINQWGVLQYLETVKNKENGQAKAEALLSLLNQKTRNLKISKVLGDTRVRGGSMIIVKLDLGDVKLQNFMMVERVTHQFHREEHWMDLTLRGGDFSA